MICRRCGTLITDIQEVWHLNDDQVAEYKEVFMLFDKDEDGVLSFQELTIVMKSLGQRPSGQSFYLNFRIRRITGQPDIWPFHNQYPADTGYGKPDIRLSKRPKIRLNMQLGRFKQRPETVLYCT